MTARVAIAFDALKSAADTALKLAIELEPCAERGFVVFAAQKLVEVIDYYQRAQDKRERAA